MNRRDPTRIELRLGDIQEYEQMKHELKQEGVSQTFSVRKHSYTKQPIKFFDHKKRWRPIGFFNQEDSATFLWPSQKS